VSKQRSGRAKIVDRQQRHDTGSGQAINWKSAGRFPARLCLPQSDVLTYFIAGLDPITNSPFLNSAATRVGPQPQRRAAFQAPGIVGHKCTCIWSQARTTEVLGKPDRELIYWFSAGSLPASGLAG
jgi:hypothetical protein